MLLKVGPDTTRPPDTKEGSRLRPGGIRIRCPRCAFEPRPQDRWQCHCLHVWNTFETGGVCPACGHKWSHTCCPRCRAWSRHEDWYVQDEPDVE